MPIIASSKIGSFSYTGSPGSSNRDAVRFRIGDVNPDDPLLYDEEIDYCLSQKSDNIVMACILAIDGILARLTRDVDQSTGSISESLSQQMEHYRSLRKQLALEGAGEATPYAAGISISDMETNDEDTDRPRPWFEVGMMDSDRLNDDWNPYDDD